MSKIEDGFSHLEHRHLCFVALRAALRIFPEMLDRDLWSGSHRSRDPYVIATLRVLLTNSVHLNVEGSSITARSASKALEALALPKRLLEEGGSKLSGGANLSGGLILSNYVDKALQPIFAALDAEKILNKQLDAMDNRVYFSELFDQNVLIDLRNDACLDAEAEVDGLALRELRYGHLIPNRQVEIASEWLAEEPNEFFSSLV